MLPCEAKWYAVQTKPRQEQLAADNLLRQSFHTYLPKIRTKKHRRGKWAPVVEPLFPRYLFICVDPTETSIVPVRSTIGVAGLVKFGSQLKPVPGSVIDYLQNNEEPESHERQDTKLKFVPGERLEILDGPFKGLNGIFQLDKSEDRALMLISLLGRDSEVAIEHNVLRKF
ncbi:MAG: transcriptional antiterminator RfaH [Halieaceae bacterium]|jgi:transcriptional antiterminator RfaH